MLIFSAWFTSCYKLRLAVVLLHLNVAAADTEIAGVKLPQRVQLASNGPQLVLNGAGVRSIAIFEIYVAALYLPAKNDNSEAEK